jgi:hypothetical protein
MSRNDFPEAQWLDAYFQSAERKTKVSEALGFCATQSRRTAQTVSRTSKEGLASHGLAEAGDEPGAVQAPVEAAGASADVFFDRLGGIAGKSLQAELLRQVLRRMVNPSSMFLNGYRFTHF